MNSTLLPHLPPLAGVCLFAEVLERQLAVEDCVAWLKRHHYVLVRMHQILTARITAEPLYELKTAFSYHAYLCAEHVTAFRQRVSELREPPLGLDQVPHPGLQFVADEILNAPSAVELVWGVYEVLLPAVIHSLEAYQQTTNPLMDAPSCRINRFCLLEAADMRNFGTAAIATLVTAEDRPRLVAWSEQLQIALRAAGGLSGRDPVPASCDYRPTYSQTPYVYDRVPRRDARFQDSYNAGVNPEAFLYDERFRARDKVLMLYYKRLREIDVPEMMAGIIHETVGKPWRFYRDMSRQLWDEARHAMFGEIGFVSLGLDWSQIPINFTWSLNLNTQLTAQERHAVLFFIEQGLMPKTGKRYEWEVAGDAKLPLARFIQDFDWADEVLHAQIGREWYVKDFPDLHQALDYGDRCWSKVLSHWRAYLDQGLTQHHNWWPDVYRQACQQWQLPPDPTALAFAETYETIRADLKTIAASA